MVMFPDKDGTPWKPPAPQPKDPGKAAGEPDELAQATGFLPLDHPGRKLKRYDVPQDLWKYWSPALNT